MKQRITSLKKPCLFIALLVISASCRKEYTCECTAKDPQYNESYTQVMSSAAARDWCASIGVDGFIGVDQEPVEGWKCELKP